MKVKELIAELQKYDPDLPACVYREGSLLSEEVERVYAVDDCWGENGRGIGVLINLLGQ